MTTPVSANATDWCAAPPQPLLLQGIAEFNRGEYYACHETLEQVWMPETPPFKEFYQGIIQIDVGLYHLEQGNYAGARSLLERGLRRLLPFAPVCHRIDVSAFAAATEACIRELTTLGPGDFRSLTSDRYPKITLHAS